jgi:hypothetical protein
MTGVTEAFTAVSALAFLCLAATLVARDVLPRLG